MKYWLLPAIMLSLALVSVLTLKSVAPELAAQQAIFFIIGFAIFFLISRVSFDQIQNLAWPFYILVNLFLIVSYFYGVIAGETGRWIPILGQFNAQPSQLAIPATALVLTTITTSFNKIKTLLKALAIIFTPAILILIEPDLGTTLVYLASTGIIIFLSDISGRKISNLITLAIIGLGISWLLILKPYQKQRLTSFISPSQDTQGAGYNARQALIAAGSGQLFGQGLGQGAQSHLRFLPERQTDFIFASLAEEFGFIGGIIIIGLYISLITQITLIGLKTSFKSAFFFCFSLSLMTAIQVGINIGMNIGLMPITGITLPFLSYGGSSILSLAFMYAIAQSIKNEIQLKATLHLT